MNIKIDNMKNVEREDKLMPAWGMHLLIAKKLNEKLKIKEYNTFLIGNIITDINNGYIVSNVSKIISHQITHYQTDEIDEKTQKPKYYDIPKFIQDNQNNLKNPVILGYVVHLLADLYWNNLTYTKHGVFDSSGKSIGLIQNDGTKTILEKEESRKIKTEDFKKFTNYIYSNNLVDIPQYEEKAYELAKQISVIDLSKEDIKKAIAYINFEKNEKVKTNYRIFTQKEMLENIDKCVKEIERYIANYTI